MNNNCGRHWLLLRGLARESAHWGDFVPQLQAAFPAATVTTLDLPGTGRFFKESSPRSITAITGHVRALALAQGYLDKPVTLLAVSLGAMVAWDWLQRYPGDSCGAVLMNTSFASLSPFYQRLRWQSYAKFLAMLARRDVSARELAVVKLVSNRKNHYPAVAAKWAAIQTERPIGFKNSLNQIMAAASYKPAATKPTAPVLLLNSPADRLVSPACSTAIQQQWALELHSHPWAGHDLTLDDGAWVVAQLKTWAAAN
jgi:pimeloyl-ACP methyl ester carboxylesterase